MAFRVHIEREECISCAACWSDCPEVFEEGDDGLSSIVEQYRVGDDLAEGRVPDDLEDCVTSAADGCPVEVIEVEEE
ncbi:MAG: ferredoxin [Chloroflexi bacterium]|nr:ferredoxin [Chloroflexota bacterium]